MSMFGQSKLTPRSPIKAQSSDTIGLDRFKELMCEMKDDIAQLTNSIHNLKEAVDVISANEKNTSEKVVTLDKDKRRKNLIIKGLIETEANTKELEEIVLEFVSTHLKVEIDIRDIDVVFRIGKKKINYGRSRPILLKLTSERKKIEIMKNKKLLKGTEYYVDLDLSKEAVNEKYEARKLKKLLAKTDKADAYKRPREEESFEGNEETQKKQKEEDNELITSLDEILAESATALSSE